MSEAESHSAETTEADKVNSGAIGTILAVGAAAMVGISFALYALVRNEQATYDEEQGALANLTQVSELKRTQRESLNQPSGWADAQKSAATLPIADAKQLFLKEVTENPFAASPSPPDAGAAGAANVPEAAGTGGAAGTPAGATAIDPATSAPIAPATGSATPGTPAAPTTGAIPAPKVPAATTTVKPAPVAAPKAPVPTAAPVPKAPVAPTPAAPTASAPQVPTAAPTPPPAQPTPAPGAPAPDGKQ